MSSKKLSTFVDRAKIGILSVPFNRGQKKCGVELGPKFLKDKSKLLNNLTKNKGITTVKDFGSIFYKLPVQTHNLGINTIHVAEMNRVLSEKVFSLLSQNYLCLTLGGDHSIAIGTLHGHLKYNPQPFVFWIDAHADINTLETTNTGNLHGMPLGFLIEELRYSWKTLPILQQWLSHGLSAKNLAYIGLRDVEEKEQELIKKLGIQAYGMKEVKKFGVNGIVSDILSKTTKQYYHVSFDIDGLDITEAPSTGTPVENGLTLDEGKQIVSQVYETGRLLSMDLVEVNPKIGSPADVDKTLQSGIDVVKMIV